MGVLRTANMKHHPIALRARRRLQGEKMMLEMRVKTFEAAPANKIGGSEVTNPRIKDAEKLKIPLNREGSSTRVSGWPFGLDVIMRLAAMGVQTRRDGLGPCSISLQIRWLVVDIVSDREATLDSRRAVFPLHGKLRICPTQFHA